MDLSAAWQRAQLLAAQRRFDLAIDELRKLLAMAPDFAPAHAYLAFILGEQGKLDEALAAAQAAIAAAPELALAHRALAKVLWQQEQLPAAAAAAARAIELDPEDAENYAWASQIALAQKQWQPALALAERGLTCNGEDVDCLNLRSIALTRLGRGAEAQDALDASLARDPDNPYTHMARGHALLHRGDAKAAAQHFQEALRRDPMLDGARAGLVEALKARNPLYRWVLRSFLWLERVSNGRQQQILLGAWLLVVVSRRALTASGSHGVAAGIGLVWFGVVMLTACIVPLFNLLLLLHPIGRHALPVRARHDALLLLLAIVLLLAVLLCWWPGGAAWAQQGWLFALVYLLPVAGLGLFHPGWGRRALQAFCVVMLGLFGWWAWEFAAIERGLLADAAAGPSFDVAEAVRARLQPHAELLWQFVLAAALSTWFVMLAPKGRRPRRG